MTSPKKYTSLFDTIFKSILDHEGGYVDHPSDPGGATKYGVSLRFLKGVAHTAAYQRIFGHEPPSDRTVKALTVEDAKRVFEAFFYLGIDDLKKFPDMAREVADLGYNAGMRRAIMTLQRALNNVITLPPPLDVDGALGPKTLAVYNALVNDDAILRSFQVQRQRFYQSLVDTNPKQYGPFLRGWLKRSVAEDTPDLDPSIEGNTTHD